MAYNTGPTSGEGVAAVDRALAILGAFGVRETELTLAQLAQRTGLYKSTILRLTESLQNAGYVRRRESGRYAIGPEPLRLAHVYQESFHLRDVVQPTLRELAEASGDTASFYVRDGNARVCLHRVEPLSIVRVTVREGERLPLDRGASGHVLLAFSGASGERYEQIRAKLFATSLGERDPLTAAMAVPVFGPGDVLVGALNLSGLRERYAAAYIAKTRPLLLAAGAALTRTLGGAPTIFGHEAVRRAFGRAAKGARVKAKGTTR